MYCRCILDTKSMLHSLHFWLCIIFMWSSNLFSADKLPMFTNPRWQVEHRFTWPLMAPRSSHYLIWLIFDIYYQLPLNIVRSFLYSLLTLFRQPKSPTPFSNQELKGICSLPNIFQWLKLKTYILYKISIKNIIPRSSNVGL